MQYSGEILRVCGVAILCVISLMILGRFGETGIGVGIRVGGGALIFGIFILVLRDNVEALEGVVSALNVSGSSYVTRSFNLMLKALGIALLCKLCSDVCRDCGEGTIASGVEGVGRVAIFSLCIPVISEIIEYASEALSMGG